MDDVVTIDGFGPAYRIINPGPGRVGSKLAHHEPYEKALLLDVQSLGLIGSAFDIGAHIGNHSLFLAACCGLDIHAWEPHRDSLMALRRNIKLNPGLNIKVHAYACGDSDTVGRLTAKMSFGVAGEGDVPLKLGRGAIKVHRIDDNIDVPDVAVIKVDVEGMESEALAGAVRHIERSLPVIYAEAHTRTSSRKVAAVLEPFGYEMTKRVEMGSPMERWQA